MKNQVEIFPVERSEKFPKISSEFYSFCSTIVKLCFAPMDGITNCATRLITSQIFQKYHSSEDTFQLRTEFMNADGFIINPSKVIKHILTTPEQKPIAQIY